jgi:hypothetical protein
LPTLVKPVRRLMHHIGRRGGWLLFLAFLDLIYAFALLKPTAYSAGSPGMAFLMRVAPLWIWALLWGWTGLCCLFFAFRRWDAPGYAMAMFTKSLWAMTFLLGWLAADLERGYLSAVIWGGFAGALGMLSGWEENRSQLFSEDEK